MYTVMRRMTFQTIPRSISMDTRMTVPAESLVQGVNKESSMLQKIIFVGPAVPISFCSMHTMAFLADHFSMGSIELGFPISDTPYPSAVTRIVQERNTFFVF